MKSLILQTASKLLFPLLLLFSIFLFLRGHNEPGGGFIGGLVGAGAFTLYAIAEGVEAAKKLLRLDPRFMIGLGLFLATLSGIISIMAGTPFLTGIWAFPMIYDVEIELGSPILFDVGVYLVVVGFTLAVIFSLEEEG